MTARTPDGDMIVTARESDVVPVCADCVTNPSYLATFKYVEEGMETPRRVITRMRWAMTGTPRQRRFCEKHGTEVRMRGRLHSGEAHLHPNVLGCGYRLIAIEAINRDAE